MLDDILLQVQKPGRYIGEEWNVAKKDFAKANIRFALCFPDLYEVGMSNLGVRIIYGLLNDIDDMSCERFFSPDVDMEAIMRQRHIEIFSLESKRSLREFDIVGFSLGHELSYTNVLNILDLGLIPLKSSLRGQEYPLVIGGGPCALNPEPVFEFFDLFVLGEAEEVILEIIDVYRKQKNNFKASRISKQDLLVMFSQIKGVYVPSLYETIYNSAGKIESFKPIVEGVPEKIEKRILKDLNKAYTPLDWLVPYVQIVHDRISLEIMRGCPNTCRFCQARSQYFPFRQKGLEDILNLASNNYKRTGYEEISLCGLSVSDYARIEELLRALVDLFRSRGVSLSLPSIKPKTYIGRLSSLLATIKKTGLTFAPEAASVRLRKILSKEFDMEDFFQAIEQAYIAGYQHIKLYFMIGLPHEELKDLDDIIEFVSQVSELRRKIKRSAAGVNISVNALIPKPHTPFQWLRTEDIDIIRDKQNYLKKEIIKNKKLKLSFHNSKMGFLEGVLSRGDRRLSQVISSAFKRGARFDGWQDYFRFDCWQAAFLEFNIDPDFYLEARSTEEILPWDFLDIGISRDSLVAEFKKVIAIG